MENFPPFLLNFSLSFIKFAYEIFKPFNIPSHKPLVISLIPLKMHKIPLHPFPSPFYDNYRLSSLL